MKIFCTSDIHGQFRGLQEIIEFVNRQDDISTVIFAGDIVCDYRSSSILDLAGQQIKDYKFFKFMITEILNKRAYYIRGNHDVFIPDTDDMNFLPNAYEAGIENLFVPFEKMSIQFYDTDRECSELELDAYLKSIDIQGKYLIAHQPPFGILDGGYSGHNYGSMSIKNKIIKDKPKLFICGHIHEDFGVKNFKDTTIINCACQKGITRGIIFDTDSRVYRKVGYYSQP